MGRLRRVSADSSTSLLDICCCLLLGVVALFAISVASERRSRKGVLTQWSVSIVIRGVSIESIDSANTIVEIGLKGVASRRILHSSMLGSIRASRDGIGREQNDITTTLAYSKPEPVNGLTCTLSSTNEAMWPCTVFVTFKGAKEGQVEMFVTADPPMVKSESHAYIVKKDEVVTVSAECSLIEDSAGGLGIELLGVTIGSDNLEK